MVVMKSDWLLVENLVDKNICKYSKYIFKIELGLEMSSNTKDIMLYVSCCERTNKKFLLFYKNSAFEWFIDILWLMALWKNSRQCH